MPLHLTAISKRYLPRQIAKPLKSIRTRIAPRRKLPLSSLLIVPFVLQLFAAVGLVGFLSFQAGHNAVTTLANQLMDRTSAQVDAQLDAYLALPMQLTQINIAAIANGNLDINNPRASERYFWQQAKTFQGLSYTGFSLADGRESGAGRWISGADVVVAENLPGKNNAADYLTDAVGNRTQRLQTYEYDPLSDQWYQDAVAAGKPIWTRVYVAQSSNVTLTEAGKSLQAQQNSDLNGLGNYVVVSAAAPFYDQNHRLLGAVGVDLLLKNISEFLQNVKTSPASQIFIIGRDGRLVASSSHYPIFHKANQKLERLSALESQDPGIRSTAQALKNRFGALESIQQSQKFRLDSERRFTQITPWRDPNGLDWLVVVTIPESDFMTQIEANTRMTIVLCFAALIGAIVLGVLTARLIVRPIKAINRASAAIAVGNWSQKITQSNVRELDALAQTFEQMAQQLQQSFSALAQTNEQLEDRVEQRTVELQTTLQELKRTQSQMIQAEKMSSLGQLVAGVAHEINNPVNFIHGNLSYVESYAQSLLELVQLYQIEHPHPSTPLQIKLDEVDLTFLERDLSKILQSMNLGSDRIRNIVRSLRSFSRLDESDIKRANIHDGIESTLLILQHRLKAANIQIVRAYAELPEIECYVGQLNQVLMNVLSNAIDATLHAEIRQITVETLEIDADWVEIAIADTGIGMGETVRQRIFDPFFTTKPVGAGTGIGLSIAHQIIVETHGGRLLCESTLHVGTKFLIQIPKRQRD